MVTILGLGFTGQRLARRLLARNLPVQAIVRGDPGRFRQLEFSGLRLVEWSAFTEIPPQSRLFHSIPPLPADESGALHRLIEQLDPARVVYISSTGVYGAQEEIDETSIATPVDSKGRERLAEEMWLTSGSWSLLILRAAAIYGPGRGVHTMLREGRVPRSAGIISRIHVEDLAALADAALFSNLEGAWPVADDLPCSSGEIAAALAPAAQSLAEVPISGRRVDGRKIRELLRVELQYPSWKTGIPAAIEEELREAESKS